MRQAYLCQCNERFGRGEGGGGGGVKRLGGMGDQNRGSVDVGGGSGGGG